MRYQVSENWSNRYEAHQWVVIDMRECVDSRDTVKNKFDAFPNPDVPRNPRPAALRTGVCIAQSREHAERIARALNALED